MVENACLALSRIAEALALRPEHLEMLCSAGLISNAVQLVAVSESGSMTSQLSVSTYYGLIRLLTTCARGSHAVAESLLTGNMSGVMRSLMARCASLMWTERCTDGILQVTYCNLFCKSGSTEQHKPRTQTLQ